MTIQTSTEMAQEEIRRSIDLALKNEEPEESSSWETQIDGDHYTKLAIQPMEYSMRNNLDALQHTIIKYVTRFRDKGGIRDLLKAGDCIDMLIEYEESKSENGESE